jgi:PhnB protein
MTKLKTSILPWLSVRNSSSAGEFYKMAFGATETYRMEDPDGGLVLRLSVEGAEFWVSGKSNDSGFDKMPTENLGGDSIKIVLTVDNPDGVFEQALKVGAKEVFPVGEAFGWRLGRLSDPFGLHWEIGKPLTSE